MVSKYETKQRKTVFQIIHATNSSLHYSRRIERSQFMHIRSLKINTLILAVLDTEHS
jgi:hypothetical protein